MGKVKSCDPDVLPDHDVAAFVRELVKRSVRSYRDDPVPILLEISITYGTFSSTYILLG
ncbi:13811_t:CDS:2 [Rhizophagus irregularis]|nr:13811_t:CDS:2 [Rhizophagus irregularis]